MTVLQAFAIYLVGEFYAQKIRSNMSFRLVADMMIEVQMFAHQLGLLSGLHLRLVYTVTEPR